MTGKCVASDNIGMEPHGRKAHAFEREDERRCPHPEELCC